MKAALRVVLTEEEQAKLAGIRRALKIYRLGEPENWDRVRAMARFFDRLANTGSVARYHHTGTCFLPKTGEPVAYLAMELLSGKTLDKHVRSIKGTRRFRVQFSPTCPGASYGIRENLLGLRQVRCQRG